MRNLQINRFYCRGAVLAPRFFGQEDPAPTGILILAESLSIRREELHMNFKLDFSILL